MADQTLTLVQAKLSNRASSRQQVSRAPPSNRVVRQAPTRPLAARTRPPSSDRRALTRQLQRKRGEKFKKRQNQRINLWHLGENLKNLRAKCTAEAGTTERAEIWNFENRQESFTPINLRPPSRQPRALVRNGFAKKHICGRGSQRRCWSLEESMMRQRKIRATLTGRKASPGSHGYRRDETGRHLSRKPLPRCQRGK